MSKHGPTAVNILKCLSGEVQLYFLKGALGCEIVKQKIMVSADQHSSHFPSEKVFTTGTVDNKITLYI